MLPLLVRVRHAETGAQMDVGFRRSPVRIGRNRLNDLRLDEPFVSQWHGIVRFDDEGTRFLDVGSTNGTLFEDDLLEKNVELEMTQDRVIEIGPLTLSFVRLPLDDDQAVSRRATAFRLGGTSDAGQGNAAGGTLRLSGKAGAAAGPPRAGAPVAAEAAAPASPPKDDLARRAEQVAVARAELGPLYEQYTSARDRLEARAKEIVDKVSPGPDRDAVQSALRTGFERALDHAAFRAAADAPPPTGTMDMASWLGRLVPPGAEGRLGEPSEAMERAGALLEAFAQAYVNLRDGQQQVRTQLSVEVGGESSPLAEMNDSRELLVYMLAAGSDAHQRVDELARAFADIVLHQLGMVNGSLDGARALISQLSPHALGAAAPGELARTSLGFGDLLWPFRAAGHYYRFAARQLELSGEDQVAGFLFGSAFARAYYRVTGARGGRSSMVPRVGR